MEIKQQSIEEFIENLASKQATPGGGSAAAIMGAMSSALVCMVANLTVGKKNYAFVETQMLELLNQADELRSQLLNMIHADIDAFDQVMSSYRLPKQTTIEKEVREQAIQSALKTATDVPLECAEACRDLMGLCRIAAEIGNKNVASDAGVAVLAAQAALRSAALNVYINIGNINDESFIKNRQDKLNVLLEGAERETEEIFQLVKSKL